MAENSFGAWSETFYLPPCRKSLVPDRDRLLLQGGLRGHHGGLVTEIALAKDLAPKNR
jgi:hypothetical protein